MLEPLNIDVDGYLNFRSERTRELEEQGKRFKQIKEIVVLNDRLVEAVDQLEFFFHSSGGTGEQSCLRLAAPTRAGKTTAIRLFGPHHPPRLDGVIQPRGLPDDIAGKKITQPILYVQIPVKQAIPQLAEAILKELRDPAPSQGKQLEKVARIELYVRQQGVRLIILDELQHLISRENDKVNHDSADWIKERMNSLPCGFILAGTEKVLRIFKVNEQLRGRTDGSGWQMRPWDVNNETDFAFAQEYYAHWDYKLMEIGGFNESGLSEADLVARLLIASQGWPGAGAKLLHNAARHAIYRQASSIEIDDFADTFDELRFLSGSEGANPFRGGTIPSMAEIWPDGASVSDLLDRQGEED